jgi:hypothetical protein
VSAKTKLNFLPAFCFIHLPPSVQISFNRLSTPKFSLAMFNKVSSLSIYINADLSSIPSNIQVVANPVPVPSSKNLPPGFVAAKVLSNEQVSTSEGMLKPFASVAFFMASYANGYRCFISSIIL